MLRICHGVILKRKELELYLKENHFDVVVLNETYRTKKIDFRIQGYDAIKMNDQLVPEVELPSS